MAVAIKLPDIGTNVEECRLQSWRVKVGDLVSRGQILADIETDKATMELESTAAGVILRQVVSSGEAARTGDILAYVGKPGEVLDETLVAAEASTDVGQGDAIGPALRSGTDLTGEPRAVATIVRNLATKLGVDLANLRGTGIGGVITRADVLQASRMAAPSAVTEKGEPLTRNQAAVARAVLQSWSSMPHYQLEASIDMTAAQRIRTENAIKDQRPSFDAIFIRALAKSVQAVPRVGAKLSGERVFQPTAIDIALVVGTGDELFMPVVRDADQKDLSTIQAEIADLTGRASAGTLKAEQMTGSCMALSNLGMYPIEAFNAIVFPENSAILAVGAVTKKPVVIEDRVEIRPMVKATLSVDHRLINGRTAGRFLAKLKQIIEAGDFA